MLEKLEVDASRLERRILITLGKTADNKLDAGRTYWLGFVEALGWAAYITQAQKNYLQAMIKEFERE